MKKFAKLHNFDRKNDANLSEALKNVAEYLNESKLSGRVNLVIMEDKQLQTIQLDLDKVAVVTVDLQELARHPKDFLIYVRKDALMAVLRGHLSPLEAIMEGQLRYGGDERFGLVLFRQLAQTQNAIFEPCDEKGEVTDGYD